MSFLLSPNQLKITPPISSIVSSEGRDVKNDILQSNKSNKTTKHNKLLNNIKQKRFELKTTTNISTKEKTKVKEKLMKRMKNI